MGKSNRQGPKASASGAAGATGASGSTGATGASGATGDAAEKATFYATQQFTHNGAIVAKGDAIELTAEELEQLDEMVSDKPPKRSQPGKRKAGKFRVLYGCVRAEGRAHQQGDTVVLSEDDARRLGDMIEAI
jgi:hypothetical protein